MKEGDAELILGDRFSDPRGTLEFFNSLDLQGVKRVYFISHNDTINVRAWQGHKSESKWFHVVNGSFKIVLVKPDNWDFPSEELDATAYSLTENDCTVLKVPGGYATGIKAMTANSKLMVFSNFTLAQSNLDDFRFDRNNWYKW